MEARGFAGGKCCLLMIVATYCLKRHV
jgi:hypothetical protein